MQKIVIILQARMGSTRLPGKSLKEIRDKPMLSYAVERLQRVKEAESVVVATTINRKDDAIAEYCKNANVACFRGSADDVLDRFYQAAKHIKADIVIRITGDCPLIDPHLVSSMIRKFQEISSIDYLSNTLQRTYPRGLDIEIFTFKALEEAARKADKTYEREHVTPYIYQHPQQFKVEKYLHPTDLSFHRWTVDTEEDFELIKKIITSFDDLKFTMDDILKLLKRHPDWLAINAHIEQKKLRD